MAKLKGKALAEYEAGRNLGKELLAAAREIRSGKAARAHRIRVPETLEPRMPTTFKKLNLKSQTQILVLYPPDSFGHELKTLRNVQVHRQLEKLKCFDFALAFATKQSEVTRLSKALAAKAAGDAVLWIAYPKGTSKKYPCDFNRDNGWDELRKLGFDTVRQVAIDEDWSALRFRRLEFIKRAK